MSVFVKFFVYLKSFGINNFNNITLKRSRANLLHWVFLLRLNSSIQFVGYRARAWFT